MLAVELSKSWPILLARMQGAAIELPPEVEVFFIAWRDHETDEFKGWGLYLSTSEPSPHPNCDACIVASVNVPINGRDNAALEAAIERGMHELGEIIWQDRERSNERIPSVQLTLQEFRNKLGQDLLKARDKKFTMPIEVVSQREFAELLRGSMNGGGK